jgi:hypothetical protein
VDVLDAVDVDVVDGLMERKAGSVIGLGFKLKVGE